MEEGVWNQQAQPGAQHRAQEGGGGGDGGGAQADPSVFQEPEGGQPRAEDGAALVGSGGGVGRQSGQQIGGQGDEPAAAGHCVHQSGQKDQRADD